MSTFTETLDNLLGRRSQVKTINPATEEQERVYDLTTDSQLDQILDMAVSAFDFWKSTSFKERAALMKKVSKEFSARRNDLARLATLEMGKLYKESLDEVDTCIEILDYYAANAEKFLQDKPIETKRGTAYTAYEPIGVILSVQPWNFPFYQVIRNVAPNLMAGNTCILKHAENIPQCAGIIQKIFDGVGFPEGVFTNVYLHGPDASDLAADDRIAGITFTGSEEAGSSLAKVGGQNLKPVLLELGGSDPVIILDDADMDLALELAVMGRLSNAGQVCTSPKRIIIMESLRNEFVMKAMRMYHDVKIGDPMDKSTQLAPLSSESQMQKVLDQINESVSSGARLVYGGKRVERKGWYVEPTILTDIPEDSVAYEEEIFGPVLCIYGVKNEDEAVRLANDNKHGLGGSVISKNQKRAEQIARRITTGMMAVNGTVGLYAELPFGGTKKSGYGRELGQLGIYEFTNPKTIHIPNAKSDKKTTSASSKKTTASASKSSGSKAASGRSGTASAKSSSSRSDSAKAATSSDQRSRTSSATIKNSASRSSKTTTNAKAASSPKVKRVNESASKMM